MPQVIVNKAKWEEGIEGLELFRKLAKQVLSQLSYTPAAQLFHSKLFSGAVHLFWADREKNSIPKSSRRRV